MFQGDEIMAAGLLGALRGARTAFADAGGFFRGGQEVHEASHEFQHGKSHDDQGNDGLQKLCIHKN